MMKLLFVLFVWLTATADDVVVVQARASSSEWQTYQCNLPMGKRPQKAACFCGYLKDREQDKQQSTTKFQLPQSSVTSGPVACSSAGQAAGFPCHAVALQSHLDLAALGGGASEANDIWGWTDPDSGREFALLGLFDGTAFVEITDPGHPVYVGTLPSASTGSSWRDVKTYQNYAYIVSEAAHHGMQVFDLTQLVVVRQNATTPVPAGVVFNATAHYTGDGNGLLDKGNVLLSNAHNVVINEDSGFAYVVGSNTCAGGLHMVDLSVPTRPAFAGCYTGDGYVHDAHCVMYHGPDLEYNQGSEICFCSNEDTITIVDVSNKSSPVLLSRTGYGRESGYTHQGWLSEDHKHFVFGDETDEEKFGFNTKTLVMDVQNLNNPFMAGSYFGNTKAIDHNLYNKGGFTYLASYRAGLRVLRMDSLSTASFSEIGFFDIYPSSDSAHYNGAWSVYPFFASGNVIVSGIEQGLFVLQPDLTGGPICNNNGVCEPAETCHNCPADCASQLSGRPRRQFCCNGYVPGCGASDCICHDDDVSTLITTPAAVSFPGDCGLADASCSSDADCCSTNCRRKTCKGGGKRRLGDTLAGKE